MALHFEKLFSVKKPIIGMIHLAGDQKEKITRVLEELTVYEEEDVDGAIIEDYYGNTDDVQETLKRSQEKFQKIIRGVNVLSDPYSGFGLAHAYGARFVQFDTIQTPNLDQELYNQMRSAFPDVAVLGSIGFKYTRPTGNPLQKDLKEGQSRCEAIVTTGEGTVIETPLNKLEQYKKLLGEFPLIVGAGVILANIEEQLAIADGAIIGSYFKPDGDTYLPVDRVKVRSLMDVVKKIRDKK